MDSRKSIMLIGFIATFLLTGAAAAGDWAEWRGPNRDGVSTETGLLQEWPEAGPALAWKAEGLGDGYSSVAIAGDRLYTAGDIGDSCHVFALDLSTGKTIWMTKFGKQGAPGWGGFKGPRSTPTVDGDLLFTIGQYGEVVCLETKFGKEVWRKHLVDDFGGAVPQWGYSESMLVDGDKVLCTPGGSKGAIVALDKKTGAVAWQSKEFTDAAHYSSLVRAKIGGVEQYVQLTCDSVAGVGRDGGLLWRAERKGNTAVVTTPIVEGDRVYVASGYNIGCNAFDISRADDGTFAATKVYAKQDVMVNHHGGVVLVEGHLYGYCDRKGWVCQNLASGEVVWAEKGQMGKGSLVYADGRLYLREEDSKKGLIAIIDASPEGYKERGRFSQPDTHQAKTWPHPVVAGGKLFIRDQDILLCYDVKG